MILVLLLLTISFVDSAFLNTQPRPQSDTTTDNDCFDYDVLVENLNDPSSNVDQCGDPLRINRRSCASMKIGQDLKPKMYCFLVDYIISTGCSDHIVYSVDPNQKPNSKLFNVVRSNAPVFWEMGNNELEQKLELCWKYFLEHKVRQSIVVTRRQVCRIS
ncbi:hypothetical protein ACOME3_006086 [Neoechinorhynchus agilis]